MKLVQENLLISLWVSIFLWVMFFLYGLLLFWNKKPVEVFRSVKKLTIGIVVKEYFLYVLFILISLIVAFFIESLPYLLLYLSALFLGLYLFLFQKDAGEDEEEEELIEIGDVKLEKASLSKANKVFMGIGAVGFVIFSLLVYKLIGFIGGTSDKVITTLFCLAGPVVYPIVFWISYTDRFYQLIFERFLYLLIGLGVIFFILFYPALIENSIASIFFISIFLIFLGIISRIRVTPGIGYMDIPVFFSMAIIFNYYAILFFFLILVINFIEGLGLFFKYGRAGSKDITIGMYGYAFIAYIALYVILILVGGEISLVQLT